MNGSAILRILQEVNACDASAARAYLLGAAHDGTFNRVHSTLRIAQADPRWLEVLRALFAKLGSRSWIYREGQRNVWVIETSCTLESARGFNYADEQAAFVRGYFDAEGGIPTKRRTRFYIQFTQKDKTDLGHVRSLLCALGVSCGTIHNPSKRVDPNYWRFYVAASSVTAFIGQVGSWHPRKRPLLAQRVENPRAF